MGLFQVAPLPERRSLPRRGMPLPLFLEHEYEIQGSETVEDAPWHIRPCLTNFDGLDSHWSISKAFREGTRHLIEPPAWGEGPPHLLFPASRPR